MLCCTDVRTASDSRMHASLIDCCVRLVVRLYLMGICIYCCCASLTPFVFDVVWTSLHESCFDLYIQDTGVSQEGPQDIATLNLLRRRNTRGNGHLQGLPMTLLANCVFTRSILGAFSISLSIHACIMCEAHHRSYNRLKLPGVAERVLNNCATRAHHISLCCVCLGLLLGEVDAAVLCHPAARLCELNHCAL